MKANNQRNFYLTGLALVTFLYLGNPFPANAFPQNSGGAPHSEAQKSQGVSMMTVTGKVLETTDSGGYTYALVEKDGGKTWVALPKSKLVVGDEIDCRPGLVMTNFVSKSLNRVFDKIVFSGGVSITSHVAGSEEEAKQEEAPPAPKPPENWKNF